MIVDAHVHLFRDGFGRFRGASPLGATSDVDAYEGLMVAHGIEAGLVVCYQGDGIDPANNDTVRQLATTRPWIASLAYLPLLPVPEAADIEHLLAAGHKGIALYAPDIASGIALAGWPAAIWERLGQVQAIVSLNARPEAIAALDPVIEHAPGCAFLFAHLGLPGPCDAEPSQQVVQERLAPLLRLAAQPHVGVKLSGLYAIDAVPPHHHAQPFVACLLERFAPDNLHWGSDFSPLLDFTRLRGHAGDPGARYASR